MHDTIRQKAAALGFAEAFFLPPTPLPEWASAAAAAGITEALADDPAAVWPFAKSILVLVYPYLPYPADCTLPAYYFASHRGYQAMLTLAREIAAMGLRIEKADLPLRALLQHHGIGVKGRNGLLRLSPYGSRFVLYALALELAPDKILRAEESPCPENCRFCQSACPAGAIAPRLTQRRCLRFSMDTACHPEPVREKERWFLGCEACLFACPHNAALPVQQPSPEVLSAFSLPRLIRGDAAAARALVGRNLTGNGKLTAEAILLAARSGLYQAEITEALKSPFPAVQETAAWALKRYF